MAYNDQWRIDPFTGVLNPVSKSESHTIRYYANFNRYGIQTIEGILKESPSTVAISGYTEVARSVSPASDQFRVDYDSIKLDGSLITNVNYYNTGFIEFHPSQNGISITVAYRGTGRICSGENFAALIAGETVPGNLSITGNLDVNGIINRGSPSGSIVAWPVELAPPGWLHCRGQAISRVTYADLFALLGIIYGNGDGSTTFNLPDYRGYFLRGRDAAATVDPDAGTRMDRGDGTTGDNVGTKQEDEIESHTHGQDSHSHGQGIYLTDASNGTLFAVAGATGVQINQNTAATDAATATNNASGGSETRPKNIYVNWIIKI